MCGISVNKGRAVMLLAAPPWSSLEGQPEPELALEGGP